MFVLQVPYNMVKADTFLSASILKIAKIFVVISLSIAYVAYIYNAWLKYDKGQVGTSISTQHTSRISLPDFSICSLMSSNDTESLLGTDRKKLIIDVMNTEQFFSTIFSVINSESAKGTKIPIWSMKRRAIANAFDSLICDTISLDKEFVMDSGSRNGESIVFKMESGSMSAASFMGSVNESKSLRFITMDIEKTVTLNREDEPCLEKPHDNQENFHRCIWRYYNEKYSCYLGGFFDGDAEKNETICSMNASVYATNEMLRTVAKSPKEIYEETKCLDQCVKIHYKKAIGESQLMSGPSLEQMIKSDFVYTDILYLYIPTSSITVKEEFILYDWLSLLADCGGMGGILLGLSMLAGYQALLKLLGWIAKGVCRFI